MEDITKIFLGFLIGTIFTLGVMHLNVYASGERIYNTHICNYFGHEKAVLIGGSWRCTGSLIAVEGLDQP